MRRTEVARALRDGGIEVTRAARAMQAPARASVRRTTRTAVARLTRALRDA